MVGAGSSPTPLKPLLLKADNAAVRARRILDRLIEEEQAELVASGEEAVPVNA